jgi:phenylpyruvate tautomerase PptA (4-oxalocrotonate tautomerase family)
MPLIHIVTSAPPPAPAQCDALLGSLSRCLAEQFGKPETWVMTCLSPQAQMTFGGTRAPCAYVEVKNIGQLEPAHSERLSGALCKQLASGLGLDEQRIYIEFTNAVGHLWGWNGGTFG